MSVKLRKQIFLNQSEIDEAITAHIAKEKGPLSISKNFKFRWDRGKEPLFVAAKICPIPENFQVKYKLFNFERLGDLFPKHTDKKEKFIEKLKRLSKISLTDSFEENLLEKVERRVLRNPDNRVFHFEATGKDEPLLLVAKIEESVAPFFRFETSVFSHSQAAKFFDGCPSDKQLFIEQINALPPLFIPKEPSPPEENVSPEESFDPNQDVRVYEHKGVSYRFSVELQKGLQNKRGVDHYLPLEALKACIQKKHAAMMDQVKKTPQKNHRFDYYFNYKGQVLNLVVDYFPSANGKDINFQVVTGYFPTDSAIKKRNGFSDVLYENFKKQLPRI